MELPLWHMEHRLHFDWIFHWWCFVSNPRQSRASCHDGDGLQPKVSGLHNQPGEQDGKQKWRWEPSCKVGHVWTQTWYQLANRSNRYFKKNKLDYPLQDTSRASRRFVRAMKRLNVCGSCWHILWIKLTSTSANHTSQQYLQQALFGSAQKDICLWSLTTYHCKGSTATRMVQGDRHTRWWHRGSQNQGGARAGASRDGCSNRSCRGTPERLSLMILETAPELQLVHSSACTAEQTLD